MNKFLLILILFSIIFTNNSCQKITEKTNSILDEENKNLSLFINKSEENLRISLGQPDAQTSSDEGYHILIYKNKKYGITCERRFEINSKNIVIGFVSNGCF